MLVDLQLPDLIEHRRRQLRGTDLDVDDVDEVIPHLLVDQRLQW